MKYKVHFALYLHLLSFSYGALAQFSDNFSDSDFTNNPAWTGDTEKFEIDANGKLHLNAPAEGSQAYLSTPSEAISEAVWTLYVEISENPSSTNYTTIYLVSDQQDLSGSLNGYFVKVGGSTDEISLYRQDGTTATEIIDGLDGSVNTKPVNVMIKVTRDHDGNWELQSQPEGQTDFISEGLARDNTYTTSSFFGFYCQYTSTRSQAFFFDDIIVTGQRQPDTKPPFILQSHVISETQVKLAFSEGISSTTTEGLSNYSINNQNPSSAAFNGTDSVTLTFPIQFNNGESFSLFIKNVSDTAGNVIKDTLLSCLYFVEVPAAYRDIVINEILPDPNPQVDSLPSDTSAEFIELYNQSESPFDLQNWSVNDKPLPSFILQPHAYVILCREAFLNNYLNYGNTIALSSWPPLSNSGGNVILKDREGSLIDSMTYESSWVQGGYSLEQINPTRPCDNRINFAVSTNPNGATPGWQNSIFNDTPDQQAPALLIIKAIQADSLHLYFDESIALARPQILVNQQIEAHRWLVLPEDDKILALSLAAPMISESDHEIEFSGIADCNGNISSKQSKPFYFDQTPPYIVSIDWLDTASIQLNFNEKLNPLPAIQAPHYTLLPDGLQAKKATLTDDSTSVLLDFNAAFMHMTHYEISVSEVEDKFGNIISDPLQNGFITENHIDTVIIVSAQQLDIYFKRIPSPATAEKAKHYHIDQDIGRPEAAVLNADNPALVHLIFSKLLQKNKLHTLSISDLKDEAMHSLNTPGYRFLYDTSPPGIANLQVQDALHLLITFDEIISDDLTFLQANIQPGTGTPVQTALQPDHKSVLLILPDSLQHQTTYRVSISGVKDLSGNTISRAKEKSFVFDQIAPRLIAWQFTSPNQLKLQFDEELDFNAAREAQHYFITQAGYPDSIIVSRMIPGTVFLSFSQSLAEGTTELSIKSLSDIHGNMMQQPLLTLIQNKYPGLGTINVLSPGKVQLIFSRPIDPATVTKDNFLITRLATPGTVQPEAIQTDPRIPASVVLLLKEPLEKFQMHQLSITGIQDEQGNTAGILHGNFSYDPMVEDMRLIGTGSLQIRFKVPLHEKIATLTENFEVPSLGHPAAAVLTDNFTVKLLFNQRFESNHPYELHIKTFEHQENGFIPASIQLFGTGEKPSFHELLITEIMADPSPAVSLPEAEYIELFNPTEKIISLDQLRFSDGSSTAIFPASIIMPGEYMIICAHSAYATWAKIHKTISLSNFPNLSARGDYLSLKTETGKEIFSVEYNDEWYKDAEKRKGGWSLEMIDSNRPCGEIDNWTASEDPSGGTPGSINSVNQPNPDHFGPRLVQAQVTGDNSLHIFFNEKMEENSLSPARFLLSHDLTVTHLSLSENRKEVYLNLSTSLPAREIITLSIKHVTDCSGNMVSSPHNTITFGKPEQAEKGDILLSEVLFAPRPGGVKFIEIYNHSDKFIELKGWSLARVEEDTLHEVSIITQNNLVIGPRQYLAFCQDRKTLKADYPATKLENTIKVSRLPGMPVLAGNIALLNAKDSIMQQLYYDEAYHHPLLKDKKGVSLERISWHEPASEPERWQSAASLAGFATPGYRNSQIMAQVAAQAPLTIDPKIFAPDQTGFADYTRIFYQFMETGNMANVRIFDSQGRKIRDLIQNRTLEQEGFITWNGTDNQQRIVPVGYYIILMEVYSPSGYTNVFKEKVAVGTRK